MSHMRTILTGNDERLTPERVLSWVYDVFGPEVDACASLGNHVFRFFFGPGSPDGEDALAIDWKAFCETKRVRPTVWMNPPYSRGSLWKFLEKADDETNKGVTTIALLPADTSTRWYHAFCEGRPTIFLKGRLKFGPGFDKPAPFASMIVIFLPPLECA